jgi:protocatechuate 3,4-dioxygenase beta subunit
MVSALRSFCGDPFFCPPHSSRGEKIGGRVRDSVGNPVAGAAVWIETPSGPGATIDSWIEGIRTSSGGDGIYSLPAPRRLRLQFFHTGFYVVAYRAGKGRSRAGPFAIPASGEPWPQVDFTLSQAGVEGKVTDGEGKAVAGAKVSVIPGLPPGEDRWPLPSSGISAYSSRQGVYRIDGIEPGDAMVVAEAIGYAPRKIPGVTIGKDVVHLDVVLERGDAVEGRVLDRAREPVVGAEVVAVPDEKEEDAGLFDDSDYGRRMRVLVAAGLTAARTGLDGAFRLADLPDGKYRIVARAPGYEVGVAPPVSPGTSGLEIVIHRFSAVSGTVLAADTREPVRRFTVDLVDPKKLQARRAKNELIDYRVASEGEIVFEHPAGRFLYDGLRPGEYVVLVQAEGFIFATRKFSLKAEVEETMEISLDRGERIKGIVLDKETGAPVVGASISFWPGKGSGTSDGGEELRPMPPETLSGPDGGFEISGLRHGRYKIDSFGIAHPCYYGPVPTFTMEVPRSDQGPIEIHLTPAGRIEGRLRGHTGWERGNRHASYNLMLKRVREDPENPGQRKPDPWGRSYWVDSEGRYHADSLEPGTYLFELTRQMVEIGEKVGLNPTGGYVLKKAIGPEEKIISQEIEVRARVTHVFNAVIPPEPSDSGGE